MVIAAAITAGFVIIRRHQQAMSLPPVPTGIPGSVPSSLAQSMELTPVPTAPAPGFTLTDQNGHSVSLASLRGHAVVLEFTDPHCTDICPIVSSEFIDAYHDLGAAGRRAIFLAVNVNPYYRTVTDVATFSASHDLTTIPTWNFLTGSLASLRKAWGDYQIEFSAPSRTGDIIHTSAVYFIDPRGRARFLATPVVDHTASGTSYLPAADQAAWGRGVALITRYLQQ